jgi:hypothetical protein
MTKLAKSAINRINCCDAGATAKKKKKKKKPEYYTCRNFRLLLGIARAAVIRNDSGRGYDCAGSEMMAAQ